MNAFAKVAVAGLSGVVLIKLFATILLPVLGLLFGLVALTFKLALVAAVAFFLYSMFKKRSDCGIEVEVESLDAEG